MPISTILLLFYFYAFLGWCCEEVFVSVATRKLVNRGFLFGPILPIYGIGALLMLWMETWLPGPILLFFCSMILLSVLEYITSVLLEKLFHLKLWDYSKKKFQIHGRVCLRNSILFGLLSVAVCYVIQPWVMKGLSYIPMGTRRTLSAALVLVSGIDLVVTLVSLLSVREKLAHVAEALHAMHPVEAMERKAGESAEALSERWEGFKATQQQDWEQLLARLARRSGALERILKAYPGARARAEEAAEALRELLPAARKQHQPVILTHEVAQPRIQYNGKGTPLFGQSASFARYFFIFFVGCVLGYFGELIFCWLQMGHLESRNGLLYGPFSQVYGMGLVIMVAFLDAIPSNSGTIIFASCSLLGGAFEYLCSYFQEQLFGSVSWDYTGTFLSLGGRTNFTFMLMWGLAGLATFRYVMPSLTWLVESIPPKVGRVMTRLVAAVLAVDILLTCAAVFRYSERLHGVPASNQAEAWLDETYPNSWMKATFPNMKF